MILNTEEIERRIHDSYELPNNVLQAVPHPMVTVRTSTYQHGPFIQDCIEGVLMQKTNFPIEFIIGEDFSTDGTRDIVFEYAKRYPDIIRVITADYNVGSKANGRRCIQASRGKYMALCEGDDYWTDPLKLQKQVDFLEVNSDCSLCFHASKSIRNNNPKDYILHRPKDIPLHNKFEMKHAILGGGGFMATNSMLFHRKYI
jgi:glycosyltransferase involved in cell wall biosynthesis